MTETGAGDRVVGNVGRGESSSEACPDLSHSACPDTCGPFRSSGTPGIGWVVLVRDESAKSCTKKAGAGDRVVGNVGRGESSSEACAAHANLIIM